MVGCCCWCWCSINRPPWTHPKDKSPVHANCLHQICCVNHPTSSPSRCTICVLFVTQQLSPVGLVFSRPRSTKYFNGTGSTIGEVQDLLFALVFLWKTTTNKNKWSVGWWSVVIFFVPGRNKCRQVSLPRSKWMDQRNADPLAPRTSSFLTLRSLFVPLCVSVYAHHHQQTSLSNGISLTTRIRSLSTCASSPSAVVGRRSVDFTSAARRVRSDEGSLLYVTTSIYLLTYYKIGKKQNKERWRQRMSIQWTVIRYSFLLTF